MIKVNRAGLSHNFMIKQTALQTVKKEWGISILAVFIPFITELIAILLLKKVFIFDFDLSPTIATALCGFLYVGTTEFFIRQSRELPHSIEDIFAWAHNFGRSALLQILTNLLIGVGLVCFIVPGILIYLTYSMAIFILADNPNMSVFDAMKESRLMMRGQKGKLFMLNLSFLGWVFLCAFTLGIGFLWLGPYIKAADTAFYNDILNNMNRE